MESGELEATPNVRRNVRGTGGHVLAMSLPATREADRTIDR